MVVEAPTLNLANLTRPPHAAPAGDPFPAKSWQQMDQEEAARRAPPPPPPQAPPLPFTYMGKLIDGGGGVTAFLVWQGQDRNYIVRDGDTIDGAYRVETINEHALILTYLPLQQQQTLALGEGN